MTSRFLNHPDISPGLFGCVNEGHPKRMEILLEAGARKSDFDLWLESVIEPCGGVFAVFAPIRFAVWKYPFGPCPPYSVHELNKAEIGD